MTTIKKQEKLLDYQEKLSDRVDAILDAEIAKGEPFTEGLSDWAVGEALREIGHFQGAK